MTIYYPDISGYQAGVSLAGVSIVMAKATEGTGYTNPDYESAKVRAAKAGAFFGAYHFLHSGDAGAQARYAHSVAGATPLMVDAEASPAPPSVADIAAFVTGYRALGGICYLLYLPRWYWQQLGSPSLAPVIKLGMLIVSSDYTGYTSTGNGWDAYGGMTPSCWQYTSSATLNGVRNVDMNAFQGSVAEFRSLAATGRPAAVVEKPAPGPAPYPAPTGLALTSVSVTVKWAPVVISGKPVASYTIQAVGDNHEVYVHDTPVTNSAVLTGLVPGWHYTILVWANGGPVAPPHASIDITA